MTYWLDASRSMTFVQRLWIALMPASVSNRPNCIRFPALQGEPAYEMKPRIDGVVFYLKVALIKLHQPGEYVLLISAHPDH